MSLLVDFIEYGFDPVFKEHILLYIEPEALLALVQTCKAFSSRYQDLLSSYTRQKVLRCDSCDRKIRDPSTLIWVRTCQESLSTVWYLTSSGSQDACGLVPEVFEQRNLMFHDYQCLFYSSRNFLNLTWCERKDMWILDYENWECDECESQLCTFNAKRKCVQVYPFPH